MAVTMRAWLAAAPKWGFAFLAGAIALVSILVMLMLSAWALLLSGYIVRWEVVVAILHAMIWPLVVALALIILRQPIGSFLSSLGTRASKIGAFSFSIELTNLPEARAWSGPALDDLKAEFPMAAMDSSGSLFKAIADTTQADYVTVNVGDGSAWITSRLYILCALIPRVRSIKRIVFLASPDETFVGEAPPSAVAEALGRKYAWLEEKYVAAHLNLSTTNNMVTLKVASTLLGRLEPNSAGQVLNTFLASVRGAVGGMTPLSEWVTFTSYSEHAAWISVASLTELLGTRLNRSAVKRDPSIQRTEAARTLLRHDKDYVAITDTAGQFLKLIDRRAAVDQVVQREIA
jgi:hypothetical protein